ncbi:chemotaxis protein CheW [Chromobacterium amazonense]|jgi:purine-binding chemotaxis protein CheW|uniref:Chemotaxis protein CheW n=1 Tax=Chromobacterium amazonense TaxID=1382803 RepID=A0A1S1XDS9_9NEIS|nr:chemotaxis protein CheW [Chromobacterium amazonense]KIA79370.1 chemotaxis protein CheW [Chromobacterium piscinae]MDE1711724.1 chemotaxis protein CheW [Chromobacterium amazonense]OHX18414.1 chemotaxis protein CheW [Chromobacterium amazonense]PRP71078.1 chemotaxis protein CheW [Chromobacterium amazonense]
MSERSESAAGAPGGKFHCVTFILGEDLFGIQINFIREIIELDGITQVPMMPSFVRGIINLRGSVVPVIDLSIRFGRGLTELKPSSCVAILSLPGLEGGYNDVGILLDAVCEVLEIPERDIDPSPTFGVSIRGDFILGIATINERFAILLNVQQALSVTELSAMAETAAQQHFNDDAEVA